MTERRCDDCLQPCPDAPAVRFLANAIDVVNSVSPTPGRNELGYDVNSVEGIADSVESRFVALAGVED
jgi:hypothetical protein